MEQKMTRSSAALGDLDPAALAREFPNQVTDIGQGVGQQVDPDRAGTVHHKFWIVAFLVAAMAVLSWFLLRGMADAWEHRGHSLSPAPAGLVL
jgi:hypothetical protein